MPAAAERLPLHLDFARQARAQYTRGYRLDKAILDSMDVGLWQDHFIGDTLNGTYLTSVSGSGTAAALVANARGGQLRFENAGADDSSSALYIAQTTDSGMFHGNDNPFIFARLTVSAATNIKIEVGFTDATTDTGAINALDTPTVTATECAVAVFDTDATEDNWQFAGARGGTAWSVATVDVAPTAGTYQWVGVALQRSDLATDNMSAFMYLGNGGQVKRVASKITGAIANTVALVPYVFVQTRVITTQKYVDLDYWRIGWQVDAASITAG